MKTSSHARSTSTIKQKPFQQELVKLDEGYQSLNSLKGLSKTDESPIAILDEDIAIREVDEFEPEGNLQYWHDFKKSLLDVDEEIETIEPRPEKIVPKRIDIIKQKRELYIPPFVKREKEVNKFRRFLSDIGLVKKHSTPMMDINEDCEDDHVDEIINISDKAPNFSSTPYTAIAEVNKKLFESKYFVFLINKRSFQNRLVQVVIPL